MGRDQVSEGVSVPCRHATPIANALWKPLIIGFGNKRSKGPYNVHLSTMCHLFWRIWQGCHFLLIGPKIQLGRGRLILLPLRFHWIPFSGFREEVANDSAQRPGLLSCFSTRPEKKFSRGRWDRASCQVLLNSIQRFQRSKSKHSRFWGRMEFLISSQAINSYLLTDLLDIQGGLED